MSKSSKSSNPKTAAKKARPRRVPNPKKVAFEKASTAHRKMAPNGAAQKPRDTDRNGNATAQFLEPTRVLDQRPAVAERLIVRDAPPQSTVVRDFGATPVKVSLAALAGRSVEDFPPQVPNSLYALAQQKLEQMRKRFEHSVNTFETALENSVDSLDAAGQGAVALNRKIRDIAAHNISTGFDLASRLARAKNVAEILEVQADYWRKQLGELSVQANEVHALLQKVTSSVMEPIRRK